MSNGFLGGLSGLGQASAGHVSPQLGNLAANQQQAYNSQGMAGQWQPQFEENVPEDELEFEGKLSRYAFIGGLQQMAQYPPKRTHHAIDCCQRMLML